MSKMINLKDNVYCILKKYSESRNLSMAACVEQAIKFSIEIAESQGGILKNNADLMNIYKNNFGNEGESYLELINKTNDRVNDIEKRTISLEEKQLA